MMRDDDDDNDDDGDDDDDDIEEDDDEDDGDGSIKIISHTHKRVIKTLIVFRMVCNRKKN